MTKAEIKQIRDLAMKLPAVYEQTLHQGETQTKQINHVRRMRKAYEKLGLKGLEDYLDSIRKLQEKRRDASINEG